MTMYVVIEQQSVGTYTASLIGWPGLTVQAASEDEALARLRQSLTRELQGARIVPLEVELPPSSNPWLELAGVLKDDPFADELQASIESYRRELDTDEPA